MADIEEAQGDRGRAREWLARAVRAPRDPMWVSDGVAAPRWTPVSPVSGEIVPCEWKPPYDMPEEMEQDRLAAPAGSPALSQATAAPRLEEPISLPPQAPHPPDDPGVGDDSVARAGG
jgi:HemY protein